MRTLRFCCCVFRDDCEINTMVLIVFPISIGVSSALFLVLRRSRRVGLPGGPGRTRKGAHDLPTYSDSANAEYNAISRVCIAGVSDFI